MPTTDRQILAADAVAGSLRLIGGSVKIIEAAAGADGQSGSPTFEMLAYTGGAMRLAGWQYPVVIDLTGLLIPSQQLSIRLQHDSSQGIGHTVSIQVNSPNIAASGVVSRDTEASREVVVASKKGFPWQASIGASADQYEFIKPGQSASANGQTFNGPCYIVRRATLGEISFVDLGADRNTSVSIAAQAKAGQTAGDMQMKTFAEWLIARGLKAEGLPQDQETTLRAEYDVEVAAQTLAPTASPAPAVNAEAHVAAIRTAEAAEMKRVAAVRAAAEKHPDIAAKAVEEGWDATKTELEVLRADRPKAPAAHVTDNTLTGKVLEAACLLSGHITKPEDHCDEKTLDAASKRFRGGIGLQELLLEAAWANGCTGRSFRDTRAILEAAMPRRGISAAFSTIDIDGILSNVANKFLLAGFTAVERTWRNICAVRSVKDFKTVTSYRLTGADQYEAVTPGGELKHGNLAEESYTNKADTYGLILSISRTDIINDDMGAITTTPRKLGRGSGLKINDVFWTKFIDNSAVFTAARNNYDDGAVSALTIGGLTLAETWFMDQVDADGKPIGSVPVILLVPTALGATGSALMKSAEVRDTTATTNYPTANPHAGKFRTEVSRYLANTSYTGYSAKAWYLLADPADLPVIEVAFLNGQESPTIETAQADFNVLGIQMRGYHDFGVSIQDYRAGVKMKGEN